MPTFVHTADGVKTVFKCLPSASTKFVRVDGIVKTPRATSAGSVTLAVAPTKGVSVEIIYDPIRTVVDRTPGVPMNKGDGGSAEAGGAFNALGYYPTAFNSAASIAPPVINYRDAGAENVTFVLDPTWTDVDVLANGCVAASRM